MKDALLRAIGAALDGIEIGYCAIDAQDRTVAWNRTFLELFPEHDGHVHAGEPYANNLRRFYAGRLSEAEMPQMERYVAEGVARHRAQRRAYEFLHRDFRVRVAAFEIGRFGKIRVWRKMEALAEAVKDPVSSTKALQDLQALTVLERLSDGVLIVDVADKVMWANDAFLAMYALPNVPAAVGRSFEDVYVGAWRGQEPTAALNESRATLIDAQRFPGAPYELRLPDKRWVRVVEQRAHGGGRGYFVHVDVTASRRHQEALEHAEAKLRIVTEHSSDIILSVNAGKVTYASTALTEVLGWSPDELRDHSFEHLCHPQDMVEIVASRKSTAPRSLEEYRLRVRHRNGQYVWVEARVRRLSEANNPLRASLVINLRDISSRKAVEEELAAVTRRLADLATKDGLTGLANRRHLDEAIEAEGRRATREAWPLAFVLIDVDDFKQYNDTHGHVAGDEVLRRIGGVLTHYANRAGDVAARYGGEELALLLPNTSLEHAMEVAEGVRGAVHGLATSSLAGPVTVSVGVTVLSAGTAAAHELVLQADAALYEAKRRGKNQVVAWGSPGTAQGSLEAASR